MIYYIIIIFIIIINIFKMIKLIAVQIDTKNYGIKDPIPHIQHLSKIQ